MAEEIRAKTERQLTELEKIFALKKSNKGLISRIFKVFTDVNLQNLKTLSKI